MNTHRHEYVPLLYATLSSVFFGSCAPVTKYFVTDTGPLMLAALFYLGSGFGMWCMIVSQKIIRRGRPSLESPVSRYDLPYLAGMSFFGGVLAPVTLMYSMAITPAAIGSLLLNFESVATGLVAAFIFREAVGRRIWVAMACITLSCLILSYDPRGMFGLSVGAVGVLLACLFWAFDNNISRSVSGKDPFMCIMIKGLSAGICTGGIAILAGETIPSLVAIPVYLLIGFLSFGGLASVFFLMALRSLGTTRTGLFLALSPFFGVFFSVVLFQESFHQAFPVALCIMVIGVYLLVSEQHAHPHYHPPLVHNHRHTHQDLHHDHHHDANAPPVLPSGYHCHLHAHVAVMHDHPHTPDLHHQHEHK
ncbi:MAG TPA: DMT family transporter [Methanospirillum sp.]|uniref:DMT family transporter n=1 Tax=Methanospirillum sp. TaxID=45200 RepID=UPI002C0EC448|nr:DMT family transporter [Methanospirillum sp.]HOJ96282.1 DMT family transporter [Methanospirillum sp.]HOL42016.1 DMT family transporter [Methanospirillum sp.]HPP76697.1 DMT family transporter [Methanospirillum sp.]